MGYRLALEKAGAIVLDFKEFGSYQGTWLAFVNYNGEIGIVEGSYGSCSYCDAFQHEFDYCGGEPTIYNNKYYIDDQTWADPCTEEEYNEALIKYNEKLADFGRQYLEPLYDKQHYENLLSTMDKSDWCDQDEKEYCEWAIEKFIQFN